MTEGTEQVSALARDWSYFQQVNDERLNEIERKGAADPLYMEHLERINAALDNHKQRVDVLETAMARPALDGATAGFKADHTGNAEYKNAFVGYLRKGAESTLENLQLKSLSAGVAADGGYLVTPTMSQKIQAIIRESSPLRSLARVETISTDSLDVIEDTGDMASGWTTETGAVSDTTTAQIGKHNIPVFEIYSQPKATQRLLDDAAIDVESWVAEKVADNFARKEATAFISGNGTTQPKGILSYTAGTSWGQIEQVVSGTSAVVTADGLINLFYSLKEAYSRNATFLMNRSVVNSVRLLKQTSTNQYLWQPGLAAGTPDTLLGAPVKMATDMPVAAANSLSVAVGDFTQGYLVVDRIGIRTLRDPFTDKPFVKFYTTKRVGGEVVNYEALKLLKLAA